MTGADDRADIRGRVFVLACMAVIILSVPGSTMVPAHADTDNTDLLLPNYIFSTNYYDSFGTPDLYASLLGDPEFKRGETVLLNINLVNKGAIYGFKYDTSVGTNKGDHSLSLKELQYETRRTTAVGIEAELISGTAFIKVEPDKNIQTMESLFPGEIPEHPLTFTITISKNAPDGVYYLQLPVSYQYQSQVRMTTNNVVRLGLTGIDHISRYTSASKTLFIPIYVKASPRFEVTDVSGNLVAGEKQSINVTYRNTGEVAATDAVVRMVVMRPLNIDRSVVRLGTIEPGEKQTARFNIAADSSAVIKIYGIDSEIKYYDEQDEITLSENLKVSVPLNKAREKIGVFMISVFGVIVLVLYLIVNVVRNLKKYD
ncbi:MAG: hypothetical protein M8353_03720 [ANME-2 cluster archaeon]|nr:hypothetical protein [ANME-2 cluster archaeon]